MRIVKHKVMEVIRPQLPAERAVGHLQDLEKLGTLVHAHNYGRHWTSPIF